MGQTKNITIYKTIKVKQMAHKILVFLSLLFGSISSVNAPIIVLNHFLVIVDSLTYQEFPPTT